MVFVAVSRSIQMLVDLVKDLTHVVELEIEGIGTLRTPVA
jgi:hypothetical protein